MVTLVLSNPHSRRAAGQLAAIARENGDLDRAVEAMRQAVLENLHTQGNFTLAVAGALAHHRPGRRGGVRHAA